ncbi:protein of unknown function (plasmid) [Cupriavidus taiwanensis]|uniref:Uncharacterized protein n=1 Tax=Cupriavidus taiwanensis TaxID=164546 RepID=A0A375IJA9_9BURK|nr:hypothetical protein CT19425_U340010 [Cupriavidus taiwanensis]SPK74806.1 protein of unknown function [Cupriavidus taiwanensis]
MPKEERRMSYRTLAIARANGPSTALSVCDGVKRVLGPTRFKDRNWLRIQPVDATF